MSDLNNNRIKLQASKTVVAVYRNVSHPLNKEAQLSGYVGPYRLSAQPNGALQQPEAKAARISHHHWSVFVYVCAWACLCMQTPVRRTGPVSGAIFSSSDIKKNDLWQQCVNAYVCVNFYFSVCVGVCVCVLNILHIYLPGTWMKQNFSFSHIHTCFFFNSLRTSHIFAWLILTIDVPTSVQNAQTSCCLCDKSDAQKHLKHRDILFQCKYREQTLVLALQEYLLSLS